MKAKHLIFVILSIGLLLISCSEKTTELKDTTISTPEISPEGAISSEPVEVYISCATPKVNIRYTTDGTEPNSASTLYQKPLIISENCTLKAKAFRTGYLSSKSASAEFFFRISDPEISPESGTFGDPIQVTMSCETPDSEIRYTTDGTEPHSQSLLYSQAIRVEAALSIKAKAFKEGHSPSNTVSRDYFFSLRTPQIEPKGGSFVNDATVIISSPNPDVEIRYSLDGSEPDLDSLLYSGSLSISNSCTLKAKAFKSGFTPSETVSAAFVFSVQNPRISPAGGSYGDEIQIQITCATNEAQIRFTTDGSEPDASAELYEGAFYLSSKCTIKAKAFKAGYIYSETVSANYQFKAQNPVISPEKGTYTEPITIDISCETPKAKIRFTTDGSEPHAQSQLFTQTFQISTDTTIKAKAFRPGFLASETVNNQYKFSSLLKPEIYPAGGLFHEKQKVTLSCFSEGADIRYTTDGSEPNVNSTLYEAAFWVQENMQLKARAFQAGYTPSPIATARFDFKMLPPNISPAGTYYQYPVHVEITSTQADGEIRYSLDGSNPNATSPLYQKPLYIYMNTVLKAAIFKEGWHPSDMVSEQYIFPLNNQLQYIPGGTFNNGVADVTISSFYISKFEVTEFEWDAVMDTTNYSVFRSNYPKRSIAWKDAIIYCNKRSTLEGLSPVYSFGDFVHNTDLWPADWYQSQNLQFLYMDISANGFRLPTEMEWMYAAKGGTDDPDYTYSGSYNINEVAWYQDNSNNQVKTVGQKQPNSLGIYDMSGNVWEFCWDFYAYELPDIHLTDPVGPGTGGARVLRGGAYNSDSAYCTVARRFYSAAGEKRDYYGFRVVKR